MDNFTKKDLKDGMYVETRKGNKYLVCGNYFIRDIGHNPIDMYNDDLTVNELRDYDIVKIYEPNYCIDFEHTTLIWERDKEYKIGDIFKDEEGDALIIYNIKSYGKITYYEVLNVWGIPTYWDFRYDEIHEDELDTYEYIGNNASLVNEFNSVLSDIANFRVDNYGKI